MTDSSYEFESQVPDPEQELEVGIFNLIVSLCQTKHQHNGSVRMPLNRAKQEVALWLEEIAQALNNTENNEEK